MKKLLSLIFTLFAVLVLPTQALAATLSLSPSTGTFNKGCQFTLDILLDTQGAETDGTDAILMYDTSRFTANSITSGSIYQDYPGNNIDEPNRKITVSGLASVSSGFTGSGSLVKINFTVKSDAPAGSTQVTFDFDPNNKAKTTDSNVVQRTTVNDVLSSVVNGNFTIGAGSCASQTPTTGGSGTGTGGTGGSVGGTTPAQGATQPVATPSGEFKKLPDGGTEQFTFMIAILGSALTILGILGLGLL